MIRGKDGDPVVKGGTVGKGPCAAWRRPMEGRGAGACSQRREDGASQARAGLWDTAQSRRPALIVNPWLPFPPPKVRSDGGANAPAPANCHSSVPSYQPTCYSPIVLLIPRAYQFDTLHLGGRPAMASFRPEFKPYTRWGLVCGWGSAPAAECQAKNVRHAASLHD